MAHTPTRAQALIGLAGFSSCSDVPNCEHLNQCPAPLRFWMLCPLGCSSGRADRHAPPLHPTGASKLQNFDAGTSNHWPQQRAESAALSLTSILNLPQFYRPSAHLNLTA